MVSAPKESELMVDAAKPREHAPNQFKYPVEVPKLGHVWLDPNSDCWRVHMTSEVRGPDVGGCTRTLSYRGNPIDVSCYFESTDGGATWVQKVEGQPGYPWYFSNIWSSGNCDWKVPTDAAKKATREAVPGPCLAWLAANRSIILAARIVALEAKQQALLGEIAKHREKVGVLQAEGDAAATECAALRRELSGSEVTK